MECLLDDDYDEIFCAFCHSRLPEVVSPEFVAKYYRACQECTIRDRKNTRTILKDVKRYNPEMISEVCALHTRESAPFPRNSPVPLGWLHRIRERLSRMDDHLKKLTQTPSLSLYWDDPNNDMKVKHFFPGEDQYRLSQRCQVG